MTNNKTVILTIGAVVIVAGVILIAGSAKKSTSQTNTATNENKQVTLGQDICAEFPKEWVASILGKTIAQTKPFSTSGTYVCDYYIDETNFAAIKAEDLSVENQKKGQQTLGRTIKTDSRIKMEHFIVWQPDGLINSIYLVLNPNRFIAIDRTSGKVFDNEGEIAFAIKVAERIQKGENIVASPSTTTSTNSTHPVVPLPQETDIVRSFFNIIGEHRPADAVSMLAPDQVNNDSQKQAWAVMFNAFEAVSVKNIESSMPEEWTNSKHTYKVTLDVKMKPESASAAIPYYGYENGTNVRFITLGKIGNLWKIEGIATGP